MTRNTNRHRLIAVDGDAPNTAFRRARTYDAVVKVVVAPGPTGQADLLHDAALTLTVTPQGSWTLTQSAPGFRELDVVIATGNVDTFPETVTLGELAAELAGQHDDDQGAALRAATTYAAQLGYPVVAGGESPGQPVTVDDAEHIRQAYAIGRDA